MDVLLVCLLFSVFTEIELELVREHRRQGARSRRRLMCHHLCRQRRGMAWHYCAINATVLVLQRYYGGEDTCPDFRLGREAMQQLMVALKTERQHEWVTTLETLVFLFWLPTVSAYRVVSRVFGMPLPTVHRVVHRMVDEVVAVLPQFVHFPRTQEELQMVGDGFARLAHHRAFAKSAGAVDGCHIRIKCPGGPNGHDYNNRKLFRPWCSRQSVTIRVALLTALWVTQEVCMMHAS
ncbi:uncharacterized protein LOC120561310 [Perca fluviatilis]|uniref:uncharacterized protein LOC120561310 n=1 Tax=Perca fluviatilis TaxID=8168 RepID=UPI001964857B|nr:uncharacterized protein LOC120561310 [Perca fluviatilis]